MLSGVAAAALGLINAKPQTVKAANQNGNRATKKTASRAVKTKLTYQNEIGSETEGETATNDDPAGQNSGSQTAGSENSVGTASSNPETGQGQAGANSNPASGSNQDAAAGNTSDPSTTDNAKADKQEEGSAQFDPAKATRVSFPSKWQGLDISFDNATRILTIGGGTIDNSDNHTVSLYYNLNDQDPVLAADIKEIDITGKLKIIGSADQMFTSLASLETIKGLDNLDTTEVTSMKNMFGNNQKLKNIDLSSSTSFITTKVTDMSYMFYRDQALTKLDLSHFDTSNVTNMTHMFESCVGLHSFTFPATFNTDKVTDMSYMFDNCSQVWSIDVTKFNTSNVENMAYMFYNCQSFLTLDVSSFNTSKVTDMSYMFGACRNLLKLNLPTTFVTDSVKNMKGMFSGCACIPKLDLSLFNTAKVTNMANMFQGS
ncbi:BspA family leucine-rich repeat surface protein [Lactobacillus sp. R2/2]|nr:BspA family leucine-rich repeat surface protein [Lactobacillus sp. R2/2]